MTKFLLLLALASVGALASVTAAQADPPTITRIEMPLTFTDVVPCANGGAGELVDFSGNIHVVSVVTINGNRVNASEEANYQSLKGVGETTGDTYVGIGADHFTVNDSLTNGQATETFTLNIHYIGQGSTPNLTLHELGHITINANGDTTVFFETFSLACG